MRKGVVALSFLLFFLLLFSYFYLPSERMNDLYQEIPAQVRENSQLIAAYYYSQTGFNGFREYQFALYAPDSKALSIYTFKTYKFLKIWPRMKKSKITCKTPFNYSLLATSPEKLNDVKNCNNCRELLYKDKIYRDEEIESIYPSIEEVIKGKENVTYTQIAILKDSEITTGTIVDVYGDKMFPTDDAYYGKGLLYLPSPMLNFTRGVVVEFLPADNGTIKRMIHYPGNITLSDTLAGHCSKNTTWDLKEVSIRQILQKLNSPQLQKAIGRNSRARFRIFKDAGTVYAWIRWIDKNDNIHAELRIYPPGRIDRRKFDYINGYHCN
ncbi:hypothetical protein A3L09_05520 [Thermococcus profundus]|uniref:Uncharacterized protein n=2 Tax=Thermococcus profundus TaxID=49899 RepID=A0A2Z2MLB3_THEPR|nr:hypothetical protein A3L09_05520 [Thermococcus profundus]